MSASKFNELGNAAMNRIASANVAGTADSPGANPGSSPGAISGTKLANQPGASSAAGIDWFSQLDSGTAHPMKASNRFGTNPPVDTVVDSIMSHLGLPTGPGN